MIHKVNITDRPTNRNLDYIADEYLKHKLKHLCSQQSSPIEKGLFFIDDFQ